MTTVKEGEVLGRTSCRKIHRKTLAYIHQQVLILALEDKDNESYVG